MKMTMATAPPKTIRNDTNSAIAHLSRTFAPARDYSGRMAAGEPSADAEATAVMSVTVFAGRRSPCCGRWCRRHRHGTTLRITGGQRLRSHQSTVVCLLKDTPPRTTAGAGHV
jgi:hypothetical protein